MSPRLISTSIVLASLSVLAGCSPGVSVPSAPPPTTPPSARLSVLAAGNASNPPSLTAVTQEQSVLIDAVQPLHPAATPSFRGLRLSQPSQQSADALVGWQRASGELVLVQQPTPAPSASGAHSGRSAVRVVRAARDLQVLNADQVLVLLAPGRLTLPDVVLSQVPEGRMLTVKTGAGVDGAQLSNTDMGTLSLNAGQSVQVIAVREMAAWLVIGRN